MPGAECQSLEVSPDGRTLAYVAQGRLHVRPLDRAESIMLEGTEGAESPFFSPDSQSVGFSQESSLKRVSVDGERATPGLRG